MVIIKMTLITLWWWPCWSDGKLQTMLFSWNSFCQNVIQQNTLVKEMKDKPKVEIQHHGSHSGWLGGKKLTDWLFIRLAQRLRASHQIQRLDFTLLDCFTCTLAMHATSLSISSQLFKNWVLLSWIGIARIIWTIWSQNRWWSCISSCCCTCTQSPCSAVDRLWNWKF